MASLDAALVQWAAQAGCSQIDLVNSGEFLRVWLFSAMYATAICVIALVPVCWCSTAGPDTEEVIADEKGGVADEKLSHPLRSGQRNGTKRPGNRREDRGPEPDLQAALEHLRKTSPTDGKGAWRSILSTGNTELHDIGGTGTELYFRLLQILGICFAIMSAVTFPITAFSARGEFAPDAGQALTRTTVGNLAHMPLAGLSPEERYVILGCQGLPLVRLTTIFGWLDFFAAIVFLAFVIAFRYYLVPHTVTEDEAERITARDFTIQVEGLPPEIERQTAYAELLSQHLLERLTILSALAATKNAKKATAALATPPVPPRICELVLVRDFNGRLASLESRAELLQQKAIAAYKGDEKVVAKLEKRIERLTKRLGEAMKPEAEQPVVRAFVTLNTTWAVNCLLHEYRFAAFRIFRCCQPQALRFQGKALIMQRAPDPTNILWENQDLSKIELTLRQIVAWLVFIVLLTVSLALVYLATTVAKKAAPASNSYLGISTCDPSGDPNDVASEASKCLASNASLWSLEFAQAQGESVLDCFCATRGYAVVLQNSTLASACSGWMQSSGLSVGIMTLASAAVVLINVVVKASLRMMATFEKPLSVSALMSSMMFKVAVAQTINTVVVITLVNYFGPDELRALSHAVPLGQLLFRGDFSDLTRGWYTVVGGAICLNMLVNSFIPGLTSLAITLFNKKWRSFRSGSMRHQDELLELYTNPAFDISERYAQMLTTVFCTLVYSSGLPLLTLFGAGYMLVTYWSDKLVLLWGSQRPPAYDAQMPREASQAMLYSVALHCLMAILMYGQPCTFPSNPVGGALASATSSQAVLDGAGSNDWLSWLRERVSREATWMFFALLLILIVLLAVRIVLWIIGGTFGELLRCVLVACRRGDAGKVAPEDASASLTWDQAAVHIEATCPPASYRMDRRLEFQDMMKYFHEGEMAVVPCGPSGTGCVESSPQRQPTALVVDDMMEE